MHLRTIPILLLCKLLFTSQTTEAFVFMQNDSAVRLQQKNYRKYISDVGGLGINDGLNTC